VLNFALSICTSGAGLRRVNASKPSIAVVLATSLDCGSGNPWV